MIGRGIARILRAAAILAQSGLRITRLYQESWGPTDGAHFAHADGCDCLCRGDDFLPGASRVASMTARWVYCEERSDEVIQ